MENDIFSKIFLLKVFLRIHTEISRNLGSTITCTTFQDILQLIAIFGKGLLIFLLIYLENTWMKFWIILRWKPHLMLQIFPYKWRTFMFKVTLTFLQIFHPVFNLQVLKEGTTVAKTEKSILSSKKKIVLKTTWTKTSYHF